jgi:hypothetical protein
VTIGRKPLSARVARVKRAWKGSLVVCRLIIVGTCCEWYAEDRTWPVDSCVCVCVAIDILTTIAV